MPIGSISLCKRLAAAVGDGGGAAAGSDQELVGR